MGALHRLRLHRRASNDTANSSFMALVSAHVHTSLHAKGTADQAAYGKSNGLTGRPRDARSRVDATPTREGQDVSLWHR